MTDTPFWKQTLLNDAGTDDDDIADRPLPMASDEPQSDDMQEEAVRFHQDMMRISATLPARAVAQLATDLHHSDTAKQMVSIVSEALAEGLSLTFRDDDASLTPDQREALTAEAHRLFIEEIPAIVRDVIEHEEGQLEDFWNRFARDILARAILDARDDPGSDLTADVIDDATVMAVYHNGPYVTGAMLGLTPIWTRLLYEIVRKRMKDVSKQEDGDQLARQSAKATLAAARRSLGLPEVAPADRPPPVMIPAFNADGYGHTDNSLVSIGARRMLSAALSRWDTDATGFPVFLHENSAGKALYSPSRTHFPTVSDAMRAVEGLGAAHVAMLKFIMTKHMAKSAAKTSGPYGGFYMTVDEYLGAVGRAKHAKGGYRPEDRREVIELIEALARMEVTGNVEGYERGKRGKKAKLTIRSPLIVVSHRVTQPGMLDGEERPIAWYLRAGDWAAELERFGPQYAVMTQALLQLNPQNDMHAFNLGNHLTEEYRIRAHEQSWQQPYRLARLLEGAEIEIDRKNPGRFRKRIEAALDVLSNPVDMQGTPIIARWAYPITIEAKGRGWFDRWLEAGIIITPPEAVIGSYRNIRPPRGRGRKGGYPV